MRARIFGLTFGLLLLANGAVAGLKIPPYTTHTLDNGLTVQILRHATVPMVSVEMWIDAGAGEDPTAKAGLASLTASSLRKGAGNRNADDFAEAIDFLGARLTTAVDAERTRIAMSLLARDLETGLSLLADAVLRPTFAEAEVIKIRDQMAEGVVQAKENPRNVLGDYSRAHLFGDHPYGRAVDGTETSLPTLDVDDVRAFHSDHYGADRAILTLAGDLDPDRALELVEQIFSSMPAARVARREWAAPTRPESASVLLVDKTDTPQTWFTIGSTGPSWQDLDDYAATSLVQTILGGRFTSWLNQKLRIEAGLTYGAGYRMARYARGGSAWISTFTATETTKEAFDLALGQLDRLHDEGLSETDLQSAKAYVKGQEPYDYETASDLARALANNAFYGIDRDFLDDFFEKVDAVTLEDCRAAVARHFQRDNLVITAVGVASEVEGILAEYGPVTLRANSAPGFGVPTVSGSR